MDDKLQVLILEDVPTDAELDVRELRRAGLVFSSKRVVSEAEFVHALDECAPDLILADYSLPQFDGLSAVKLVQAMCPHVPVIIVSATVGEEQAIESLKLGATDYVLKQRLERLGPVAVRALQGVAERRERLEAEAALAANEKRFRALIEHSADAITLIDAEGKVIYDSPAVGRILGPAAAGLVGQSGFEFVHPDDMAKTQALLGQLVAEPSQPVNLNFRFGHADGSWRWLEAVATNLLAEPSVGAIVVNFRDVTERKAAEDEIRYLAGVLENLADGIVSTDMSLKIQSWNSGAEAIFGYRADEVVGRVFNEVLKFEYLDTDEASAFKQSLETGRWKGEVRINRKDGTAVYALVAGAALLDAQGAMTGFSSVLHDITERKQAEAALRQSEERFRNYFALGLIGMVISTPAKGLIEVNDQMCAMMGYTRAELLSMTWVDMTHPDDLAQDEALFRRVLADEMDGYTVDKRFVRKDGSPINATISVRGVRRPDRSIDYLIALAQDITERKQAEAALIQSNDLLSRAEQIGNLGSWRWDIAADHVVWSDGLYRLFELTRAEFPATFAGFLGRVHPDDREHVQGIIGRAMSEQAPIAFEYRVVQPDGQVRVQLARADLILDGQGRPAQLVGIAMDITERKQAELAVAVSEADLRSLFAAMTDVVMVLDAEGRHLQIAPTNPALLVKPPEELLGRTLEEVMPTADAVQMRDVIRRALETQQPVRYEYSLPVGGATVWFEGTVSPMGLDKVFWISRDITERKQHERELEAIAAISTALRSANSLAQMLPIVVEQVMRLVNASGAALGLRDAANDELELNLGLGEMAVLTGERLPAGAGIGGQVLASGQPYTTDDVAADPHWQQLSWQHELRAVACVPLITSQHITGVMWAGRGAPFSSAEVRVLSAIGSIAASAIQRAGLHEQTERQLRRLAALGEIDNAIMNSVDLRTTLLVLLGHVTSQLGVDAADILLLSPGLNVLEFAGGRGFHTKAIERVRLRLGEGHAGRAALERRLVAAPDLRADTEPFRRAELLAGEAFMAVYSAPLVAKGQVVGVLEVFHRAALRPDAEWLGFLEALAGQAAIAVADARLFADLQRSNMDMLLAYDTTLEGWSAALDLRDKETEGHSQRVTEMTLRLARALGVRDGELEQMRRGALLHDIGKMGVPDSILHKPGKLTDEEWVSMRQHPKLAYDLLAPIVFLRPALDIPYCHHEKWDGSGYPRQLRGEAIPLAARIFAVVDVWDALRSDRPYRLGWPEDQVLAYLRAEAGQHFDPAVVEAFLALRASEAAAVETSA